MVQRPKICPSLHRGSILYRCIRPSGLTRFQRHSLKSFGLVRPSKSLITSELIPRNLVMPGRGYRAISSRISEERALKQIGTASVAIDALCFPWSRKLDPQNVDRLKRLFREGHSCDPSDFPNRIPAIISNTQLIEALRLSGANQEQLSAGIYREQINLELPPNYQLECLRGQHRVRAATDTLKRKR